MRITRLNERAAIDGEELEDEEAYGRKAWSGRFTGL